MFLYYFYVYKLVFILNKRVVSIQCQEKETFNIFISSLCFRDIARRFQKSKKNGERSVLTLDFQFPAV